MAGSTTARMPGIHHISAICGDPQRNVDFYVGLLGLRLVKKTVNFDDPGSYHLYCGDGLGSPGTIMTFFAWILPPAMTARGTRGPARSQPSPSRSPPRRWTTGWTAWPPGWTSTDPRPASARR